MAGTSVRGKSLTARPANAFGVNDSTPHAVVDLARIDSATLARAFAISRPVAERILAAHKTAPLTRETIAAVKGVPSEISARIRNRILGAADQGLHILDVVAGDDRILSKKPFTLRVSFISGGQSAVAIVAVTVSWAGEPFVVEKELTTTEAGAGAVSVEFDASQTLPVGAAEFQVALYRADGAQASFRKTYYVLPSNPLSLSLSPDGATVTGSWSVRGAYQPATDSFITQFTITIANGDASPVNMRLPVNWSFWDGPVGSGTQIEGGIFNWPGAISVPAFGVWQGGVTVTSPNGSGIYNVYHRKEDMAISIQMTATDGRNISGQITCRVMLAYGVNIIKVGDFGAQEHADLYAAVDQARQIYELRDITFRGVDRFIINNTLAGGFTILDSESEFRDLLSDWSVPNDFVDVYVVQQFQWSSYNGYAGDIPGPASKGGDKDGVAVDKTGYVDGSGTNRLDSPTLAQLIGHEVGHYLGLSHVSDANNLMLANTGVRGPDLNYDQYRTMFPHGFMIFE
jgi:hypothetical protein